MSTDNQSSSASSGGQSQEADRRKKLDRLRQEFGCDPYGGRVDGLCSLAEARVRYDETADLAFKADASDDRRPVVKVAGRIVLHRDIGRLVFATLRDHSGEDLQIAVSKKNVGNQSFKIAKLADLADLAVVSGPLGKTNTGEITCWAGGEDGFAIAGKALTPPPAKWQGLQDQELRYRRRYVDMWSNPEVMQTFQLRSRIIKCIRDLLTDPPAGTFEPFLEVETPMMQAIAGGAAARPFITHHNALDLELYLRIAPELYLKRLLVGGLPRVFEVNRNFRNEGLSPKHNPEFTMLELYQAFGDYHTMMTITETLIATAAAQVCGGLTRPFGDLEIHFQSPFARRKYYDLFEEYNGFAASDHDRLLDKAESLAIETAGRDHDVIVNEVWEATVESHLIQPTFVVDYPSSLCPLTKPKSDDPTVAERFELFVAGMELANAYTELNDPDVQLANFQRQLAGLSDEDSMAKMDSDFIEALKVGMPPAGGLGIGIDRLVMLLTNHRSIRDVILFPLMKPRSTAVEGEDSDDAVADEETEAGTG